MSRTVVFIVGFIGALMAATIAGLLAALLGTTGMTIVVLAAATFVGVIGLFMTADHYLRPVLQPGGKSSS